MNNLKEYINDMTYNAKDVFFNDDLDKINLDKIIENEYKNTFEILDKLGIIKYIENNYKINYKEPELEISEDIPTIIGGYSRSKNKIIFSEKSIERLIDEQLEFLGYKKIKRSISDIIGDLKYWEYNYPLHIWKYSELFENEIIFHKKSIEENIDRQSKFLGYKEIKRSTNDTQGIKYLNMSYNSIFLYPFCINKRNIREAIAESIIRSKMLHERWHSFDYMILDKLEKDSTIKDRDYLLTILNNHDNLELRASAFEVVAHYLANGFYKHEKGLAAAYSNIPTCREFIDKLERKEGIYTYVPYDLGFCYGNIIVAKYGPSLKENIYNIIDDIIHLDKERAIDVIKHYGDNLEWILHDKNSDTVI